MRPPPAITPGKFERRAWLLVVATLTVLLISVVNRGVGSSNLTALSVLQRLVTAQPLPSPTEYRGEVSRALGFSRGVAVQEQDTELLHVLLENADVHGLGGRPAASYALLMSAPDAQAASRALALMERGDVAPATTALWRGRASWVAGDWAGAVAHWELAFGSRPTNRKRLAEVLYLHADILLAVQSLTSIVSLAECDERCGTETIDLLRMWIVWKGDTPERVRQMCETAIKSVDLLDLSGPVLQAKANLLARRALTFEDPVQSASALGLLPPATTTPYVVSARAWVAVESGRHDEAAALARLAVAGADSDGHAWLLAGQVLERAGHRAEARAAWQSAAARAPLLTSIAESLLLVYR